MFPHSNSSKSLIYPLAVLSVGSLLFLTYTHQIRRPPSIERQEFPGWDNEFPPPPPAHVCDPYSVPGMVFYPPDDQHRLRASWQPFDPFCPQPPDYLLSIRTLNPHTREYTSFPRPVYKPPRISLNFLRNKTILILGDSVDRQIVEHFAPQVGEGFPRRFDYANYEGGPGRGWDLRNVPHEVRVEELDLTVVNGFYYGMDDIEEFSYAADWHAPGSFEERLDQLFVPMVESMKASGRSPPSFISLQSGMWDCAFFGRRDKKLGISGRKPLSRARVRWWKERFRASLRKLKETFPEAKIWVRNLHRVGDNWSASMDWSSGLNMENGGKFVSFFTDVRIIQLQALQREVAREEGVPYFDFSQMWEGWQRLQDTVHPQPFPAGPLNSQALIHHVWMEEQGRENWDVPLCQFIDGCGSERIRENFDHFHIR